MAGTVGIRPDFDLCQYSFGQFVDELYRKWIEAWQADGADPHETATSWLAKERNAR